MNAKSRMLFLLMLVSLCAVSITAGAAIIFVSTGGNDGSSGASWDTAKLTIQGGLSVSAVGDQVWVAKGSYIENVALTADVQLYGGFQGTEANLSERPAFPRPVPDANETTIIGASLTGISAAARLDGFAVRWGFVRCVQASPAIVNNTLVGDVYSPSQDGSGGMLCDNHSSPLISGNFICNYYALQKGGGIRCRNYSSPTIVNNSITGCFVRAGNGGGICCESSSSPLIADNIIGGNMALLGGGIYTLSGSAPIIANNTITGNSAGSGGGIYCAVTSPDISNNIIAFNSSGIAVVAGAPVKKNNCVYNPDGANYSGVSAGTGDISADPLLVSAQHGEVHLQPSSPCIDAGYDASVQSGWLDMDLQARTNGAHVDIGADEADGAQRTYQPIVRYVSASGSDSSDGTTWQTAKQNIYLAMMALMPRGGEVWVQSGAYTRTVTLIPYCWAYGGFSGSETSVAQRNWSQNVSDINPGMEPGVQSGISVLAGHRVSSIDGLTIRGWRPDIACIYSSPLICNNIIRDSESSGIYCDHSSPNIWDNTISGNSGYASGTAGLGGGIFCNYSTPSIRRNTILHNTAAGMATSSGGGIYCANSSPVIESNIIAGNTALDGYSSDDGGGIYCDLGTSPSIINNTISDNTVSGGYTLRGGGIYLAASPLIVNNIICFNTSGVYGATGCTPVLRNNNVYNPNVYNPAGTNYTGVSAGTGDVSSDPLFVDKGNTDYHLSAGSPCIDAGDNSVVVTGATDVDGQSRINGSIVDIGADEAYCIETPAFSPDGGVFSSAQNITVTCATEGAVIHYTTNGVDPVATDPVIQSGSQIPMTAIMTLKARAYKDGFNPSLVKSASYRLPAIIHVTQQGWDGNNGLTWATAKSSISAAISAACAHDQVWVAKGYYTPNTSVVLKKDVELYGGFAGTETALSERPAFPRPAVDSNETSISASVSATLIPPPGADASTRLDGFTIWTGYYVSGYNQKGSVISCVGSSPTICNNTLIGTVQSGWEYGGGIYCSGASPVITGNVIMQFQAIHGGAICCDNQSSPLISNNIIMRNRAGSDYSPTGSQVWTPGEGGAIYCNNQSSPTIVNNAIGGNSAYWGGAIFCKNGSAPTVVNNTITGNYAPSGAIYSDGSALTLANNIVALNSSGIFSSAAGPILRSNCVYNPDGANYSGLGAGEGDISLDPKLVAVEYGRVHVQPDSPCIDAGNNSSVQSGWVDMDGSVRVAGARVDIGADESDGTLWDPTPTVIRVKPNGSDTNDGSSWDKPMRSLMQAGTNLRYGGEVWAAAGTYDQGCVSQIAKSYVHLYGGFSGSETSRDQRDPKAHATVLMISGSLPAAPGYRVSRTDGFTITCNYAGYTAVDCRFSGSIITNNTFNGISCEYSAPVISNNTITGGKGVYVSGVSAGYKGGGIYCDHSDGEISNNNIYSNNATRGGGIYCSYSSPMIINNTIRANTGGGGVALENYSSPAVKNNLISANTGTSQGLYCALSSSPAIVGNTITANTSGGIFISNGCSPSVCNNFITGNLGIAVRLQSNGQISFIDNTVAGSTANGLYLIPAAGGSVSVANNILAFNSSGVYRSGAGSVTLLNNCVYNPGKTDYSGISAGTGDISADPLFVDRTHGDYHLTVISPCVNAGSNSVTGLPTTDIDGEARVLMGTVDIGADECALKAGTRDTKLAPDGSGVDIKGAIVSAAFTDAFYIESDGREVGIRVEKPSHGLSAGQRADIKGTLAKNAKGERCIVATDASANGSGSVTPLIMNQLTLGGGKCGCQDAVCRWKTVRNGDHFDHIWGPADGLSNIGLLVRIYGKITTAGRDWFYVDDGSGVDDRSGIIGVYVDATGLQVPPAGSFVSVTGISSCETYIGSLVNTLLPRSDSDIVVLRQADGAAATTSDNPRR